MARLSPDSKWIVAAFEDAPKHTTEIAVVSVDGGELRWPFEVPENFDWNGHLAWTPDGRGVIYSVIRGGVSNLWVRPLSGRISYPINGFQGGTYFLSIGLPTAANWSWLGGLITDDAILFTSRK